MGQAATLLTAGCIQSLELDSWVVERACHEDEAFSVAQCPAPSQGLHAQGGIRDALQNEAAAGCGQGTELKLHVAHVAGCSPGKKAEPSEMIHLCAVGIHAVIAACRALQ